MANTDVPTGGHADKNRWALTTDIVAIKQHTVWSGSLREQHLTITLGVCTCSPQNQPLQTAAAAAAASPTDMTGMSKPWNFPC